MMKQTLAILGKYRGRAFSTVESTRLRLYSGAKQVCKEHEGLVLGAGAAFMGGYAVYFCKCLYQRKMHWYKVDRMYKEYKQRSEAVFGKTLRFKEGPKPSS